MILYITEKSLYLIRILIMISCLLWILMSTLTNCFPIDIPSDRSYNTQVASLGLAVFTTVIGLVFSFCTLMPVVDENKNEINKYRENQKPVLDWDQNSNNSEEIKLSIALFMTTLPLIIALIPVIVYFYHSGYNVKPEIITCFAGAIFGIGFSCEFVYHDIF